MPDTTGPRFRATSLLLVLLALLGSYTAAQSAPEIAANATRAYRDKDFKVAASLYLQALNAGAKSAVVAYNGACSYALAGDPERATNLLDKAIVLGYHDFAGMKDDPDLVSLHGDSRWKLLSERVQANEIQFRKTHSDPRTAKFITSDVTLFWKAYDELKQAEDPSRFLNQKYLNAGTVGLQDFVPSRIKSGKNLYATIQSHSRYYGAIRENTLKTQLIEPQVRESFRKFKALYPDALFPDVYFVIGAMNSGGTSSDNGLLLGAEIHGLGESVPTDELNAWEKSVVKPYTVLPNIIAHELMHFQQKHEGNTTLAKVIHEGSADFLASLIAEGNFNQAAYTYGYAHEAELWKEFRADADGTDSSKWLYGSSQRDGRPADLGYFLGFRIAQSYYNKARDKKQAVRDIITVSDFGKLLKESGYSEQFR